MRTKLMIVGVILLAFVIGVSAGSEWRFKAKETKDGITLTIHNKNKHPFVITPHCTQGIGGVATCTFSMHLVSFPTQP
jgi:hypothetical protein